MLLNLIHGKKWEAVDEILDDNKRQIFSKLKIKIT
jgi:hypothetical protein